MEKISLFFPIFMPNKTKNMDFLTAFPYFGIIALIVLNLFLVSRRTIKVDESDHDVGH